VKYFNFLVAVLLTLLYTLGKVPPSEKYNLWLTSFLIPFGLVINIIFLVASAVLRKKSGLYYVVTLIIGSNYLLSSFGLRHFFHNKDMNGRTFRVLSYNMNSGSDYREIAVDFTGANASIDIGEWIINQEAEIQCYQEFVSLKYNQSDLIEGLKVKGYNTYFSHDSVEAKRQRFVVGTIITSKYPIIRAGDIFASDNGFNRISYADVKIDSDTLRVVNVHLESMGLKDYHPAYASDFQSGKEVTKVLFSKLKEGVFERSEQIKILAKFIESSPHAVICVGDFNELPYSYSYQFMRKRLKNSFEQVGKGFGFTYNGNTLRVLRIDNQFYSKGIEAVNFCTLNEVTFTDHFPIEGTYKIQSQL
jgi:endonuclease/exonuclease/phosphatase family metal-dependent hydrolase